MSELTEVMEVTAVTKPKAVPDIHHKFNISFGPLDKRRQQQKVVYKISSSLVANILLVFQIINILDLFNKNMTKQHFSESFGNFKTLAVKKICVCFVYWFFTLKSQSAIL